MGGNAPAPPDYAAAAEKTGEASQAAQDTATFSNRPTINTPWGSQSWQTGQTMNPSTGKMETTWTQNNTLNPESQKALDSQMQIQSGLSGIAQGKIGQVGKEMSSTPDYSGLQGWGQAPGSQGIPQAGQGMQGKLDFASLGGMPDPSVTNKQGTDAYYQQATSRLDPQWNQREEQKRSQLYNMGLKEGDQAYNQEMERFGQQRNDAYAGANRESILTGSQMGNQLFQQGMAGRQQGANELGQSGAFQNQAQNQGFTQGMGAQSQGYNQDLQSANYANALRQAQFGMQGQQRAQNLNEMQALTGGQQVSMPSMPSFNASGAAQGANYLGAAGMQQQANMDQYNANNAWKGDLMNMAGSMAGGAASMFSDERLKSDIVRGTKEVLPGVKEATFRYKGAPEEYKGVIAQDVEKKYPGVVTTDRKSGYKKVPASLGPSLFKL